MSDVRILVVHGQRTLSAALTHLLSDDASFSVVGTVPSSTAARAALDTLDPDVVLVGQQLEGAEDAWSFIASLTDSKRWTPGVVALVEGVDQVGVAVQALRAGAVVVVPSDSGRNELVVAVREAAAGHGWMPARLLGEVLRQLVRSPEETMPNASLFERLTERELEILTYLVAGYDRATVAEDLQLSPHTVRTHVANVLRKLEVHSTLEAVTLAYASGIATDSVPGRA